MIHDNWLLPTPLARELYHDYAANQPIIDYHNHLIPEQMAANHRFANLHAAWLAGDHYKWRAMRQLGVDENLITGTADPREKFRAFAESTPYTLRNPLYHWSHLELARYFGINDLLSGKNADYVYDQASEQLQDPERRTWGLLGGKNVRVICTTDDPIDDLAHHAALAKTDCPVRMLPGWRPDKALLIDGTHWPAYIEKLAEVSGVSITSYDDLLVALTKRLDHFTAHDCTVSDHGLEYVPDVAYNRELAAEVCGQTLLANTFSAPAFS
ncbi:MAG: glucuronate isomerase, partial [Bacteroidota bacterium]